MYLSHILAVVTGIAFLVLAGQADADTAAVRIAANVGAMACVVASIKLSSMRWIWIGATVGQMEAELLSNPDKMAMLDAQLGPPAEGAAPLSQDARKNLIRQRRKLRDRQLKLEAMIRDQRRGDSRT